jgi:hypothetical protein
MTLEIVLVRADGADIVLVMVTLVVANTFPVVLLFTCVLGLVASDRKLGTDSFKVIVVVVYSAWRKHVRT